MTLFGSLNAIFDLAKERSTGTGAPVAAKTGAPGETHNGLSVFDPQSADSGPAQTAPPTPSRRIPAKRILATAASFAVVTLLPALASAAEKGGEAAQAAANPGAELILMILGIALPMAVTWGIIKRFMNRVVAPEEPDVPTFFSKGPGWMGLEIGLSIVFPLITIPTLGFRYWRNNQVREAVRDKMPEIRKQVRGMNIVQGLMAAAFSLLLAGAGLFIGLHSTYETNITVFAVSAAIAATTTLVSAIRGRYALMKSNLWGYTPYLLALTLAILFQTGYLSFGFITAAETGGFSAGTLALGLPLLATIGSLRFKRLFSRILPTILLAALLLFPKTLLAAAPGGGSPALPAYLDKLAIVAIALAMLFGAVLFVWRGISQIRFMNKSPEELAPYVRDARFAWQRKLAIEAMAGKLNAEGSIGAHGLIDAATNDLNPEVRIAAIDAISTSPTEAARRALERIVDEIREEDLDVVAAALRGLAKTGNQFSIPIIYGKINLFQAMLFENNERLAKYGTFKAGRLVSAGAFAVLQIAKNAKNPIFLAQLAQRLDSELSLENNGSVRKTQFDETLIQRLRWTPESRIPYDEWAALHRQVEMMIELVDGNLLMGNGVTRKREAGRRWDSIVQNSAERHAFNAASGISLTTRSH